MRALSHPDGWNSKKHAVLPVGSYVKEDGAAALLQIKYLLATIAQFNSKDFTTAKVWMWIFAGLFNWGFLRMANCL